MKNERSAQSKRIDDRWNVSYYAPIFLIEFIQSIHNMLQTTKIATGNDCMCIV